MSQTRTVHVAVFVDGEPGDIDRVELAGEQVIRLGDAATLHLDTASPEVLFRLASVFADAATAQHALQLKAVA